MRRSMSCFILFCVLLAVAGCETKTITSPTWTANFNRLFVENGFDKAIIHVDPNGSATITFEKYKSDGTRALDVLDEALKSGALLGTGASL